MKIFSDYFDVFPRIVPADQVSEIRITPRAAHAQLPPVENIDVQDEGAIADFRRPDRVFFAFGRVISGFVEPGKIFRMAPA